MKKILLSLGALATIAAPVAAVVSCGTTPGGTLGGGEKETPAEAALRKLMEGSSSALEAWSMSAEDVTDYITTTKTEGILHNLDIYQGTNVDAKAQFVDPTNPVFEKEFTKQEAVDQQSDNSTSSLFETYAKEIKSKQEANKQYGMIVNKTTNANKEVSFKVSVFEKKAVDPAKAADDIQASIDILKDPAHFAFDADRMSKMHGTYIFGQHHSGSDTSTKTIKATPLTSNGKWAIFTGTNGAPIFHDRIEEGNLYTWTMLKAQDGGDLNGALIKDAMYVQNKKDDKYYLRLELQKGTQSATIYLVNDAIYDFSLPADGVKMDRDWMTNKFDDDAFKKIWIEKYSFEKVYALFNKMKKQASSLENMVPLKELIIDISSYINVLASTNSEIQTTDFYNKFLTFLKGKYSTDELNHLMVGIQDFKMNDDGKMYTDYIPALGGKGYNGLIWSHNLLESYVEFIDDEVENDAFVPNKISSADDFKKALDYSKIVAAEATVAKAYMDDNKIAYQADDTNADLVKQVKDLMLGNLAAAKALPSTMKPITASDDGHLKDAFDALSSEITKQDKVDTKNMKVKELVAYVTKDVKLHNAVDKINAAIDSINTDQTFDTKDVLKEVQTLGVKIPGLININVSDTILNEFVSKAKTASDTDGHGGLFGTPSTKAKTFVTFISKYAGELFSDSTFKDYFGFNGNSINNTSKSTVQKTIDKWKTIISKTPERGKLSQGTFDIINAIAILIA